MLRPTFADVDAKCIVPGSERRVVIVATELRCYAKGTKEPCSHGPKSILRVIGEPDGARPLVTAVAGPV